jgi:putrescine transport system ATP-binding protein
MDHGRVVQVATPGEIYEQPASRFVAEFVGDINIFDAVVSGRCEGGLWSLQAQSGALPLTVDDPDEVLHAGDHVAVAVRPEKMRVSRERPEGDNVIEGEIWDIGYLGDWTVYRVKLNDGAIIRITRANATRFVETPLDWEEKVFVSFDPASAVILSR